MVSIFHFEQFLTLLIVYLPTLSEFYRKGRRCKILIFNFFQPLLGLVSSPHSLFSVHSPQSQFHFHPAVLYYTGVVTKFAFPPFDFLYSKAKLLGHQLFDVLAKCLYRQKLTSTQISNTQGTLGSYVTRYILPSSRDLSAIKFVLWCLMKGLLLLKEQHKS